MTTWFVIDTKTNEIINAIESQDRPDKVLKSFSDWKSLKLDAHPPMEMLERYQYWHERP